MPGCTAGLLDLKASLERWRGLPPDADPAERETPGRADPGAGGRPRSRGRRAGMGRGRRRSRSTASSAALLELEYTLIPHGLHVVGEPPNDEPSAATMLDAAACDRQPPNGERLDSAAGRRITKFRPSCTRSTAAICAPRPAAICCARRRPADRAQSARLRSVPHSQRLRGAGRRASGRAAARRATWPTATASAGIGRDGAVGHRQSEDRGRADRPGAGAARRDAALRQLRPPGRRAS